MNISRLLSIGLISITLLGVELIWTRIFSAEFFYTFAFLTLSLAIMGLGLGALALRMFGFFNRESAVGPVLILTGLTALLGPPLVTNIGLEFSALFASWAMLGKFLVVIVILSSTFFFGGIALAFYFRNYHRDMPKMYMADLIGAALGVVVSILLMNLLSTPVATFVLAIPVLLAALLMVRSWGKTISLVLIAAAIFVSPYGQTVLEVKRAEHGRVIYKHWDAMAKIKLYDFDGYYRGLNIDNVANSPVFPFDGNFVELDTADQEWDLPVKFLMDRFDSCVFLSLGSGGGGDVLQALDFGATEVHAVEVLPHINEMMVRGDSCGYLAFEQDWIDSVRVRGIRASEKAASSVVDSAEAGAIDSTAEADPARPVAPPPAFRDSLGSIITCADYSGKLYHDSRVKVVSEDARTYVRRFESKFDLIYSFSSNSWAALASGSFALAENYIFTREAFIDYWYSLSDSGFLSMEHQVYGLRLVSEALEAMAAVGVERPDEHIAVYDLPQMRRKMILLSKQPLTDEIRQNAYGPLSPERDALIHLLYPAPDSLQHNLYNRIVTEGWQTVQDSARIDISPCTDDRPFVAQQGLWRNFGWDKLERINQYSDFMGFPLSKLTILIILAVVLLFLVPLNLIPYFTSGPKLRAAPWLYFFAIGVAFMMVEVVLIQKYALTIGASVYSIVTVLLTLLLASGIGSRFARQVSDNVVFGGILVWLVLDMFVFGHLTAALVSWPILGRSLAVAALIFPLGLFMGMPFPKGTLRVGELVDWGFSVNGAASVFGATLIVLIAFSFGFTVGLATGGAVYLVAWWLMSLKKAWGNPA